MALLPGPAWGIGEWTLTAGLLSGGNAHPVTKLDMFQTGVTSIV